MKEQTSLITMNHVITTLLFFMRQRTQSLVLLLIILSLWPVNLFAQSATATLSGTVTDERNAVVAGATVSAVNDATSLTRKATTNSDGYFTLPLLPPGNYTLRIEGQGFAILEKRDVILNVGDQRSVLVQLRVSNVAATVNVTDSASLLNESPAVGIVVNRERVENLPLNGRNFQRLVFLAPGISGGAGSGSNPAISGARTSYNTYTIDGLGANNERVSLGFAGASSDFTISETGLISTAAVQEFSIISSNADASYGRSSGGQINLVTRQGGNQFHGSLYEYLRNDALDARDFFNLGPFLDAQNRAKVPPFKQHLFGGAFGGPLVKDRHFFFGSYEGLRQRRRQQSSVTTIVPNAALLNLVPGDLGRYFRAFYLERGIVPTTGNPAGAFSSLSATDRNAAIAAGYAAALFDGNVANGEAGTVALSTAPLRDIDQDAYLIRTDHKLSAALSASFRLALTPSNLTTSASAVPTDLTLTARKFLSPQAQFLYLLTPRQTIEVRAGVMRTKSESGSLGGVDSRLTALGVGELPPLVNITGSFRTGQTAPLIDNQTTPQTSLLHYWTRGNMTFRSGFEFRSLLINIASLGAAGLTYNFNGFTGVNGILGTSATQAQAVANSASAGVFGRNGGPVTPMRGYRAKQYEAFFQTDWRVRQSLTLNLGMRYSDFGVYSESNGAISNLYAVDAAGQPLPGLTPFANGRVTNVVASTSADRPFYQPDRNNFQPRLGLAWALGKRRATVVRAGYGIYFDRLIQTTFSASVNNPPQAAAGSATNFPFRLDGVLPISTTTPPRVSAVDPGVRNPFTQRFQFTLEQQLGRQTSVSLAYVGARSDNLLGQAELNGFGGVTQAQRPDPRYGLQTVLGNISASRYHALQLTAATRFARGFDLNVAYTLGNSSDDASAESFLSLPVLTNQGASAATGFQGGGAQFVPRPRRADWGTSSFDVRHSLTISHLIDLPLGRGQRFLGAANSFTHLLLGGWSLSGIVVLRSGEPVNVTRGIDYNDDGDAAQDRPALTTGALTDLYPRGGAERTQYLLPQADALTRLATPGNVTDPFLPIRRNAFRAPAIRFYDLSLLKRFALTERVNMSFESNFFNLLNRAQFAAPVAVLSDVRFGRIINTQPGTNPRQIQFGLKLSF